MSETDGWLSYKLVREGPVLVHIHGLSEVIDGVEFSVSEVYERFEDGTQKLRERHLIRADLLRG